MAAPIFSITDGTTTVTLNTGAYYTINYNHAAPEVSTPFLGWEEGTITESIDLLIWGASEAAIQTAIRNLELLLVAALRSNQGGAPVYLQAQYGVDGSAWRTRLWNAHLAFSDLANELWTLRVNASLAFVRDLTWEGAEAELGIATQGNAKATGGRPITQNGFHNWVNVTGADVLGTLPGKVRMILTNTVASNRWWSRVYIGNNAFTNIALANVYALQGEASLTGTPTADAACYGGSKMRITLPTSPPNTPNLKWMIDNTLLDASRGHYFRILAKSPVAVSNVKARPALCLDSVFLEADILWKGNDIAEDGNYIFDWGNIALPPAKNVAINYADFCYGTYLWATAGGTLDIDTVTLLGTDSFLIANTIGYVAQNEYMEINSIDDMHTVYGAGYGSAGKWTIVQATTKPLVLFPGIDQQLRIIVDTSSTFMITDTISVRLYYRPRRLSL